MQRFVSHSALNSCFVFWFTQEYARENSSASYPNQANCRIFNCVSDDWRNQIVIDVQSVDRFRFRKSTVVFPVNAVVFCSFPMHVGRNVENEVYPNIGRASRDEIPLVIRFRDHKHENAVELPIKEKIINGRDIAKLIHCKGIYLLIFQPIAAIPQQLAYKRNFATGHYWWCVDIYVPMIGPLQRPWLRSLLQRSAPPLNFVRCRRITIIN